MQNHQESNVPDARKTQPSTPLADQLASEAQRRAKLKGLKLPKPKHTRIITVANQKGGVGKTTTAVNIAAGLAIGGLRVLVIDNDPQGNASTALGIEHRSGTPSVYEVVLGEQKLADVIQRCPDFETLFCAPATIELSGAEIELVSMVSRETRLKNALETFLAENPVDYVLIDCPPSLGLLTVNALAAAKEVMIPIQCEYYALEGLSQLVNNINLVRQHLNTELEVSTILLTMYDRRTNLANDVANEVREHFGDLVLETVIPRSVRISEAPSFGQTVIAYDRNTAGSLSYREAAQELAHRTERV